MVVRVVSENVIGAKHGFVVVIVQKAHEASSVPIVRYSSSVVDLARGVNQNFEGDVVVFEEEHVELRDAYAEISVGEFVGDVEAERAEFPSLEDAAVEERESEQ